MRTCDLFMSPSTAAMSSNRRRLALGPRRQISVSRSRDPILLSRRAVFLPGSRDPPISYACRRNVALQSSRLAIVAALSPSSLRATPSLLPAENSRRSNRDLISSSHLQVSIANSSRSSPYSRKMNRSLNGPLVFAVQGFLESCGSGSKSDFVARTSSLMPEPVLGSSDHFRRGISFLRQEEGNTKIISYRPSPREKVVEVMRHFSEVYKQLDRDKRRNPGDPSNAIRLPINTQKVLENMGKVVNFEKRIGSIPGIIVGDEFQYKTQLVLVGLHFKPMSGIDYMTIGGTKFATCIVISEGCGYNDKFFGDVVVYTGEGGNLVSKEKKSHDQKLVKGNLALANSMRKRSGVRVIRGEERGDHIGKRYVYHGLYFVVDYWIVPGVSGKAVYEFKLQRIPGQSRCLDNRNY